MRGRGPRSVPTGKIASLEHVDCNALIRATINGLTRNAQSCPPYRPGIRVQHCRDGSARPSYRGEVYRSTIWRTRLDSSTNWAVVTTGIALSATFSSAEASPLPMVLVGLLVSVFLVFEARRYRYFNVWRARARLLETDSYAPMIRGDGVRLDSGWTELLANDYRDPRYHISFARAIGRRLRRTYAWIFIIQAIAYYGKLAIHPTPLTSFAELWERGAIGPDPGRIGHCCGSAFSRWLGPGRACHASH